VRDLRPVHLRGSTVYLRAMVEADRETGAAWLDEPNTRSAAALAKQGYRRAGRLRWVEVKDGRYVDKLLFDLTRADWLAARDAWRARRAAGTPEPPATV
jgi:hypothetical protein